MSEIRTEGGFRITVSDSMFRDMVRACNGSFRLRDGDRAYTFTHPHGSYGTAYFPSEAAANCTRNKILGETGYSGVPESKRCRVSRG